MPYRRCPELAFIWHLMLHFAASPGSCWQCCSQVCSCLAGLAATSMQVSSVAPCLLWKQSSLDKRKVFDSVTCEDYAKRAVQLPSAHSFCRGKPAHSQLQEDHFVSRSLSEKVYFKKSIICLFWKRSIHSRKDWEVTLPAQSFLAAQVEMGPSLSSLAFYSHLRGQQRCPPSV